MESQFFVEGNIENKSKSHCHCAVPGCYERYGKNNISMHKLPKKKDRLEVWIELCKIQKTVTKNSRICSAHFNESDFYNYHKESRRKIRSQAVPSRRLPENDEIASKLLLLARSRKKSAERFSYGEKNTTSISFMEEVYGNSRKKYTFRGISHNNDTSNFEKKIDKSSMNGQEMDKQCDDCMFEESFIKIEKEESVIKVEIEKSARGKIQQKVEKSFTDVGTQTENKKPDKTTQTSEISTNT